MLHASDPPIAIVGGGIAGLALARALHARGADFELFERVAQPSDGGLAINLPGNAIQALAALGLKDAIEQSGHPVGRREYRTDGDRLLFAIDEDAFWGDAFRPRCIRRSALMDLLARGLPSDHIHRDRAVSSISAQHEHPDITFADGSITAPRLIVGADGVRSQVRADVFGSGAGLARLAQASWRFMAPNPGIACWTVWAGADGMILLLPVDDDVVYGWAAVTKSHPEGGSTKMLERLSSSFPDRVRRAVEGALSQPGSIHHSPLEEVRLDLWTKDRVVLIGDAAHATAPVWAEGVALALEDAIVLAECLHIEPDVRAATAAYEQRRRPRVTHVQAMTDAMSKAARLPVIVRNLLMPIVGPKRYRQTYEPLKQAP